MLECVPGRVQRLSVGNRKKSELTTFLEATLAWLGMAAEETDGIPILIRALERRTLFLFLQLESLRRAGPPIITH